MAQTVMKQQSNEEVTISHAAINADDPFITNTNISSDVQRDENRKRSTVDESSDQPKNKSPKSGSAKNLK